MADKVKEGGLFYIRKGFIRMYKITKSCLERLSGVEWWVNKNDLINLISCITIATIVLKQKA